MSQEFIPFELERIMSIWENQVEINLSESGVHPMTMAELIGQTGLLDEILGLELNYPQTNGTAELRQRIAALYPGASEENVLVTTGCAQANFTALVTLLSPGDEIAILLPNYMQIWGIARNLQLKVNTFSLCEENGWHLDVDALQQVVSGRTKMIAVCNPNNPTGHIMSVEEMNAVIAAAEKSGAWLLADEVYAGAERESEQETPSFWGKYDKVLAHGSMSKAYGLPGLRIGWSVASAEVVEAMWARQDYITIGNTMLGNKLAAHALAPEVRPRILARTREYIRKGYANFEAWCARHEGLFSYVPPQAAAIVFARYHLRAGSVELVEELIRKEGAYVVPGAHFGLENHLRISYGLPAEVVQNGLDRLYRVMMRFSEE